MFDLGLDDKVVLITGGSDGLGRATAERFALEGAKVVICARRAEHLLKVANEIRKQSTQYTDKDVEIEVIEDDEYTQHRLMNVYTIPKTKNLEVFTEMNYFKYLMKLNKLRNEY